MGDRTWEFCTGTGYCISLMRSSKDLLCDDSLDQISNNSQASSHSQLATRTPPTQTSISLCFPSFPPSFLHSFLPYSWLSLCSLRCQFGILFPGVGKIFWLIRSERSEGRAVKVTRRYLSERLLLVVAALLYVPTRTHCIASLCCCC